MKLTRKILIRAAIFGLTLAIISGCSRASKIGRTLNSAQSYYGKSDYASSEIEFKRVLQMEPANTQAIKGLGLIRVRQGASLDGFRMLKLAKSKLVDDNELSLNLALSMFDLGFTADSRKEVLELLSRSPEHAEGLLLLAETSLTPALMTECEKIIASVNSCEQEPVLLASAIIQLRRGQIESGKALADRIVQKHPEYTRAIALQGAIHMMMKEPQKALAALKRSAEMAGPRSAEVGKYANLLLTQNRIDDAITLLERASKKAPDYLPNWRMLGRISIDAENDSKAEEYLSNVLVKSPLDLESCVLRSQIWLRKNEPRKAVELLEKLNSTFPSRPRVELSLAKSLIAMGELRKATKTLDHVLVRDPENTEAILLRAVLYLKSGDYSGAIDSAIHLLANEPSNRVAKDFLVLAYRAADRVDDAISALKEHASVNIEDYTLQLQLGNLLVSQGKAEEARNVFEQVLKLSPDHPGAVSKLIALDQKNGKHEDAMNRANEYLSTHPDSSLANLIKAVLCFTQKDFKAAETFALRTAELNPKDITACGLIVNIQVAEGRSDEAINQLKTLLKNVPNNIRARMQLAILHEKAGNVQESRILLEEVISMAPDFAPAYNNLACIHSQLPGNMEIALKNARVAQSLAPDDPAIFDTLGWVEWLRGNYQEAMPLLMKAASRLPLTPSIQYHLAMAHYMFYQIVEAESCLESAILLEGEFREKNDAMHRLAILRDATSQNIETLQHTVMVDPGDIVLKVMLARKLSDAGRPSDALAVYEDALSINPGIIVALLGKAELYAYHLNGVDKALEAANLARKIDPRSPSIAAVLGMVNFRHGNHAEAFALLSEAASSLPEDPCVQYDYAWASYSIGRVAYARAIMDKLVVTYPKREREIRDFLTLTDENVMNYPDIADLVDRYMNHFPERIPALMAHAALQKKNGESPESSYSEVIEAFPKFDPARLALARCYMEDPTKLDEAEELAIQAREQLKDNAELSAILAIISYGKREFDYSALLLMELSKKRPLTGRELFTLGMSYEATKRSEEARETLAQALRFELPEADVARARSILNMN